MAHRAGNNHQVLSIICSWSALDAPQMKSLRSSTLIYGTLISSWVSSMFQMAHGGTCPTTEKDDLCSIRSKRDSRPSHSNTLPHCHTDTRSLTRSLIHSFTHSVTHSFIHSFVHSFACSFIHSYIHSFTHSFVHSISHCSILNSYIQRCRLSTISMIDADSAC